MDGSTLLTKCPLPPPLLPIFSPFFIYIATFVNECLMLWFVNTKKNSFKLALFENVCLFPNNTITAFFAKYLKQLLNKYFGE